MQIQNEGTETMGAESREAARKPTMLARFAAYMVEMALSLRYRIKPVGLENIPKEGPALLAPNHVSYIDALAIAKRCPRPVRFVMAKSIYQIPLLKNFLDSQGVIPIAGAKEDPAALSRALDEVSKALRAGELVCIFPEGKLTRGGEIGDFKGGIARILERDPVPVVPIALKGLWGSVFTHRPQGLAHFASRLFARRRVVIEAGTPIEPSQAEPVAVREAVLKMRGPSR
jgi:1-acyl-sn-glycerol-3-phosphate acyltransferase